MAELRYLLVSGLAAFLFAGCGPANTPPAATEAAEAPATPAPDAEVPEEPTAATADGAMPSDAAPAETVVAAAPSEAVAADADAWPTKVTLGDASLTAGVPGEGPLTVAQIKAWVANPAVHETLDVSLPFGLSLASGQIVGLEENPMTRAKIELGRQLYFDPRLSADASISCASCHAPDQGFAAHTQFGVGINGQTGGRNSPVSYNRILSSLQFWDGRAATLEEQAKGPIANPIEMGNTHATCVECVQGYEGYRVQFDAVFGPDSVNIDNIAKAIATFERAIVTGPSPYDYYAVVKKFLDRYPDEAALEELKADDEELYDEYLKAKAESDAHPISDSAIRGMALYFSKEVNCAACHAGANFTDEKYHNIGVGMDKENPDLGRFVVTENEADKGAFKTPTIRNVERSAPYMHDGSQKTLEEVVEWYAKGGHPNPYLSKEIKELKLTPEDKADLVAFMKATTGAFPHVEPGRLPQE